VNFSYYVGSCTTRNLGNRFSEHIRDTLGFRYYIRDRGDNWSPEASDPFWSRMPRFRENAMEVLDYLERGSYAWAVMAAEHTRVDTSKNL
jgi:hypothetical protein